MKRPPGATYSDPMFTPLQKFVIYSGDNWAQSFLEQAAFIALLLVVLPPGLKLIAWKPIPEKPIRYILLASMAVPWSAAWNRLFLIAHKDLFNARHYDPPDVLRQFAGILRFLYPYHTYTFLAIAIFILILIFRRAHRYIFSPNHCPACAYPLDAHMTACPECGHARAPQQPPLPEG